MDWLDLLAVQETLKSLLQHYTSKASILQHSAFFIVQLSHPYMTTGKTIALTRWTFVGKVMSLLFNMLSRLVITFLPKSKCLSISWLQSPSAVILAPKNKVCHCFHCFPIYLLWSDGTGCHDLSFLNVEFLARLFTLFFHLHQEALWFLCFLHKNGVINNLRYADDTTLRAESEELKSLLMKVKEESEKASLKFNIQKTKIMASSPIISSTLYDEM